VKENLMSDLLRKLAVVLGALPGWLAALTALLTVFAAEVVPQIPGPWGVRAAALVASALAVLRAAGEVVARVTPVRPSERGVLPS
jgi:hypothetical protein